MPRLTSLLVLAVLSFAIRDADSLTSTQTTDAPTQQSFGGLFGSHCTSQSECGVLPGLACVNGVCDYCREDADCSTPDSIRRCHTNSQQPVEVLSANGDRVVAALCVEKDLFAPFLTGDVIATVLAFLSTALGSGCGVGGGGLLVPAFIMVTGLSPKHAIPLSKATIFGNAVAIYLFNVHRTHPLKPHMPVINYDLAAIMEPTTLIGTVLGVMLNHMLPNWLILLMLMSLLAVITHHTFRKGQQIHEKETQHRVNLLKKALTGRKNGGGRGRSWSIYRHFDWQIAARRWLETTRRNRKLRMQQHDDEADFELLPPLVVGKSASEVTPLLGRYAGHVQGNKASHDVFNGSMVDELTSSQLHEILEHREADKYPMRVILPLLSCWLVVLLQALLRGGHGSASVVGISCDSIGYWLLTLVPLIVLVLITWRIGYRLRLENRLRVKCGYPFLESDTHWTLKKVTKFPFYCTTAGVAAGLLGIGGGMVKSPIMLEMGILPAVQSATASYMILYTSSSTTLQFAIGGQFPGSSQYDYAAWFAFVGFLGGLCGQNVVGYLVKKYKRESIVVYTLAATIGLSALAMGVVGVSNTIHDYTNGANMGFNRLCGTA